MGHYVRLSSGGLFHHRYGKPTHRFKSHEEFLGCLYEPLRLRGNPTLRDFCRVIEGLADHDLLCNLIPGSFGPTLAHIQVIAAAPCGAESIFSALEVYHWVYIEGDELHDSPSCHGLALPGDTDAPYYGIDGLESIKLADTPLVLNPAWVLYPERHLTKSKPLVKTKRLLTLGEVFYGLFYELTWDGGPGGATKFITAIKRRIRKASA